MGDSLKYFKTDFIESESTDKNKRKLVNNSTDMICLKENAFNNIVDNANFKIFQNNTHHVGIIFDDNYISDFIKQMESIKGKFNVYIFSLNETVPIDEFDGVKERITLCPIPESMIQVYRRIWRVV